MSEYDVITFLKRYNGLCHEYGMFIDLHATDERLYLRKMSGNAVEFVCVMLELQASVSTPAGPPCPDPS